VQLIQRNIAGVSLQDQNSEGRKKNFFERKRFLNYASPASETSG
jgi:hypothetical protein